MQGDNTFEAQTLEEVYEKASHALHCSITDLEIEIIQAPSKGFLGFFAKTAIIRVALKNTKNEESVEKKKIYKESTAPVETLASQLQALNDLETPPQKTLPKMVKQRGKEALFDQFYDEKNSEQSPEKDLVPNAEKSCVEEISIQVNALFQNLSYDINPINVSLIENNSTVCIEFSGNDSALLIGKEGYRYKALSYILFNWINQKYNLMVRLEVAQFLENQEAAIESYLDPIIEIIQKERYFKTKVLDGILIHIALTKLREAFPDMYVAVKTTQKGEKYILINEYRK